MKDSSPNYKVHYALWEVTQRCNLSCLHCRADASPNKYEPKLIKNGDIFKLIDGLSQLNCPTLALTGGEPLLREDIVQIVKYASSKNIKTRIQSNGLLLTKEIADELKKAGLFSFGIGLDASTPEINDKIRNKKGALLKAIESIKILKERNMKVHVEFTVTKLNLNNLTETLNLLEELGVDTFLARAAIFTGRARPDDPLFQISLSEYKNFLEKLSEERLKRKITLNCQDPLYHLADESIVNKLKNYGDIYSGCLLSGCTAGLNMIHIRSNGEIGICTFLPDITLGNIFEKNLPEIWNKRFAIPEVKKLIDRDFNGRCGHCADKFICGGCRARALLINNDLFGNDPYCWKYCKNTTEPNDKVDLANRLIDRSCGSDDYEFVHDISMQNMKEYVEKYWGEWNSELFKAKINKNNITLIEYNGQNVAFFDIETIGDELYLHNMQVAKEFQNQGIGAHILFLIGNKANGMNVKKIKLKVFVDNPAVTFYEKNGFIIVEQTGNYLCMEKVINKVKNS